MEFKTEGTGYKQNDFKDVESHPFGIDDEDEDTIASILRDKIYSNPIQVICQEYICNGRDSNVEAKNEYNKLDIFVPSHSVPKFQVRDYGVGLSKENIKKIYIKLGKSTKRSSSKMIGAYGLGSKSGFSYNDSFLITSWYNGTKTEYIALIAENMKGDIKVLSEETTNEPNGIEILVNLKSDKDLVAFKDAIFRTTAFWEKQPNYLNILEHEVRKYVPRVCFKNEDLLITSKTDLVCDRSMILCDGVPYPFNTNPKFCAQLNHSREYSYFFIATNATVTPAASRENVTKDYKLELFTATTSQKIQQLADAYLKLIQTATSMKKLYDIYFDIPFIPTYEEYTLNCLPEDILFTGYDKVMIPSQYLMTYNFKSTTKWEHHQAYEFITHHDSALYLINDSKISYQNIARRLKNSSNPATKVRLYLIFNKVPPKSLENFFNIKSYESLKPKIKKVNSIICEKHINYYKINRNGNTKFKLSVGVCSHLAINGHYYAIMNG